MSKKLIMAVMAMVAAFVATADNWSFTYQAELKDATGTTPLTGDQKVEIRLWKTANSTDSGDLLWGRLYSVYLDQNGLFNLEVSDNEGSSLTSSPMPSTVLSLESVLTGQNAGALYIGLTVSGQGATEIVPRQRIFAVPYAAKANRSMGLTGSISPVDGVIQFKEGGKISSSGVTLTGSDSSIKAEHIDVKTISATGNISTGSGNTITTGNLAFSGTITKDGSEVLPVPVGGIILWNKTTPPEGGAWSSGKSAHWAICDGGNGTPNLKGRFVVGIDPSDRDYDGLGDQGGAKSVALSVDQMPSHTHTTTFNENKVDFTGSDWWVLGDATSSDPSEMRQNSNTKQTSSAGANAAHENRPPYYAIYYIMRIK